MSTEKIQHIPISAMVNFAGSFIFFYEVNNDADSAYIILQYSVCDFDNSLNLAPWSSTAVYDMKTKNTYEKILLLWQENAAAFC